MSVINVKFGPDQMEALDELAESLDCTKASLIRYGVKLLQLAVRESSRGNALGVVRGEKVVKEVVGVWDEGPRTAA